MWPIFVRTVGIDILPAPFVDADGAAVAVASNVDNIWDFVTASCNSVLLASVDGGWYFISLWEFIHLIINIGISGSSILQPAKHHLYAHIILYQFN